MGMRKKYESGAATNYIARRQALRKLQLSLRDFRRLCIIKGIHPHEPKRKKKANKGSTQPKTWYFTKDIQHLSHEPLINKFREFKVFLKRARRAKLQNEYEEYRRIAKSRPSIKYDGVIKERYPNFVDAIHDMDDALCLAFLFSKLRKGVKIPSRIPHMCRRLTVEFMHYVIQARALRKVFVSIKGIYYQVEVMGETITWITPHDRVVEESRGVDMSLMVIFVDFYITMMGFVNFRLYQTISCFYPPRLGKTSEVREKSADKEAEQEIVYSLGEDLTIDSSRVNEQEITLDEFKGEHSETNESILEEMNKVRRVQHIFDGLKFFLSREVPRESLTFIIRCCGGMVSWDETVEYGSLYSESDPKITHQITDRPQLTRIIGLRAYVQPQWVYDCVNAGTLLPVQQYFPDATLPPHLSPFVEEKEGEYISQDRIKFLQLTGKDVSNLQAAMEEGEAISATDKKQNEDEQSDDDGRKKRRKKAAAKLSVAPGNIAQPPLGKVVREKADEKKLEKIMMPKKYRRVFKKIQFSQKRKEAEKRSLMKKRQKIDNATADKK